MVAAIVDFAKTAACARPGFDESFRHDQVCAGYLSDGRPVAVGDVRRPVECPQVAALFDDPGLLAAATDFLGYVPKRREARLYWSFAAPLPDDVRRAFGQTIDFHYDVPWFNAVDAYFYLTPSDRYSGAHVIYRQSARHKPARFKLASAFNDEKKLTSYYGSARQHVIEGPAGFGFMVDPFGFHKAFAPVKRDRLMLQLRYS